MTSLSLSNLNSLSLSSRIKHELNTTDLLLSPQPGLSLPSDWRMMYYQSRRGDVSSSVSGSPEFLFLSSQSQSRDKNAGNPSQLQNPANTMSYSDFPTTSKILIKGFSIENANKSTIIQFYVLNASENENRLLPLNSLKWNDIRLDSIACTQN